MRPWRQPRHAGSRPLHSRRAHQRTSACLGTSDSARPGGGRGLRTAAAPGALTRTSAQTRRSEPRRSRGPDRRDRNGRDRNCRRRCWRLVPLCSTWNSRAPSAPDRLRSEPPEARPCLHGPPGGTCQTGHRLAGGAWRTAACCGRLRRSQRLFTQMGSAPRSCPRRGWRAAPRRPQQWRRQVMFHVEQADVRPGRATEAPKPTRSRQENELQVGDPVVPRTQKLEHRVGAADERCARRRGRPPRASPPDVAPAPARRAVTGAQPDDGGRPRGRVDGS